MHRLPIVIAVVVCAFHFVSAKSPSDFDLKDSRVSVPWQEFKHIIDRLSQPDTIAIDTLYAPADYVLTSAQIKGDVIDNKSARFTALVDITALPGQTLKQNGWIAVRLGPLNSTAILKEASVGGKPLPLYNENNEYRILLSKAGAYSISLTYYCGIASTEGTSSITLPVPATLAASLDFTIPNINADITINGAKAIAEKTGGGVHVRTAISIVHGLQIDYTPLGALQEGGEDTARITPRVYAATGLLVDIRENMIRYRYRIDYQIWHKKLSSFAIALPDTFAIEEVEGAGIAQWKVERQEGKPVLSVQTNFTPEKEYSLSVQFSRKLETKADRIAVPPLRARWRCRLRTPWTASPRWTARSCIPGCKADKTFS
jgi:hypothetical protein